MQGDIDGRAADVATPQSDLTGLLACFALEQLAQSIQLGLHPFA